MIWGYHGILMGTILENLNQSGRFPVDLPKTTAKKGCSVQKNKTLTNVSGQLLQHRILESQPYR